VLNVIVIGAFSLMALALILFAAPKMGAESFELSFWHFKMKIRWPHWHKCGDDGDTRQP
jgi:hypothetical protein